MATNADIKTYLARDWEVETVDTSIRIAVVGLGRYAVNQAIPAINFADHCSLGALVSGSPEKAERVAEQHSVEYVLTYDEFHEGMGLAAYDAVYIGTPHGRHLELAESAAGFGKHVLCEKPLEMNSERAKALVRVCNNEGVTLMTAYRLQTDPVLRFARGAVREGRLGEPIQFHAHFSVDTLKQNRNSDHWALTQPEISGGGALMDIGVYPVNTSRFLFEKDPVGVQASTVSRHEAFEAVDEHVNYLITYPDGLTGACTASFNAHETSVFRVIGSSGILTIEEAFETRGDRKVRIDDGNSQVEVAVDSVNEVVEEFDYFAYCVQTGCDPEPSGADGLTDVRTLMAIYEAAESGQRVGL
jgi:xylose dehydrogenase (NAD/NADP)